MKCPSCKNRKTKKAVFYGTEADYCPKCLGLWFEEDELRRAKDEKDKELIWLDIDLWKDKSRFKITQSPIICPLCSVPMYSVKYGDSQIEVDLCNLCHSIWLDRGEFKKIINYLKERGKEEVLKNYLKNLFKEGAEIIVGPETFDEEVEDFLALIKLLNYKLMAQYPKISQLILGLPK